MALFTALGADAAVSAGSLPDGKVPPPGIAGHDDRSLELGSLAVFRKGVGRLLVPVGRRELKECTAFCVDRQWIMTAAHCLAGLSKAPRRARFVPEGMEARQQGVAIAWPRRNEEAWNAVIGGVAFPVVASRRHIQPDRDWVALPLRAPVCGTTLPILPVQVDTLDTLAYKGRREDSGIKLSVLAYHGDRGHRRLMRSARCGLAANRDALRLRQRLSPHVILHDCDLAFGASGSPLFMTLPFGRHAVVGMNVAIFERNQARIGRLAHGPLTRTIGRAAGEPVQETVDDGFVANMAVSTSAFAAVVLALRQEGPPLTDRRAIATVQRLLKARGLNPGPIDGVLGPRTRKALIAYRRSQGMEPVALASSMVLESLRETVEVTTASVRAQGRPAGGVQPRPRLVPAASHILKR